MELFLLVYYPKYLLSFWAFFSKVKEQALCLLANIADGDASKKLIVDNEDMLKKLKSYMLHNVPHLQVSVWREITERMFSRRRNFQHFFFQLFCLTMK